MNDRGAIMTVGAFMATFLVGVMYTAAGISHSVVYQERLQDAADDASFAAAVTHARAMNTISDLNATNTVTQASVSAFNLALIASQLCVDFQIIRYPEDYCERLLVVHTDNRNAVYADLVQLLREGSSAAAAVADRTPTLAASEVQRLVGERAGGMARYAFLVPRPMAVSRGTNSALCAMANPTVFRLVRISMGVDIVHRLLGDGEGRIGRDLPQCRPISGVDALVTSPPNRPVGTEPFQVRVVVVGNATELRNLAAGVRVPYKVNPRAGDLTRSDMVPADMRAPPSTLVVSQAEYYSYYERAQLLEDTATNSVEEDQFRMDWRARLRRFRYPTGGVSTPQDMDLAYRDWITTTVIPACNGNCGDVLDQLLGANDALH